MCVGAVQSAVSSHRLTLARGREGAICVACIGICVYREARRRSSFDRRRDWPFD